MIDVQALKKLTIKELVKTLAVRHPWVDKSKSKLSVYQDFRNKEIDPKTYLLQGKIESNSDFALRGKLAIFAPETPRIVNRIMGFLRHIDCNREKLDDYGTRFAGQADKRGRSLGRLVMASLEDALYMGAQFILVDRAAPPINPETGQPELPGSVLENEKHGLPFCVNYGPDQLVNWKYGEGGGFDWIVLRERITRQDSPIDARQTVIIYRLFDRESWAKIELIPHKIEGQEAIANEAAPDQLTAEITGGTHSLGIVPLVPVVPFPLRDDKPAQGVSFVDDAVERDVVVYRQEADHIFNQYLHMHPQLVIKSNDIKAMTAFKTNSAIRLSPAEQEDAFYIGPPADIFQQAREIIRENRQECWISTGQEAASRISKSNAAKGDESGYHKRLSFEMAEGAILGYLSDGIVSIEQALFECQARYMASGDNPGANQRVFQGEITRRKSYDLFWIGDFIDQFIKSREFLQHSPTFMVRAIQRISRAMLDSPAQDVIDKIGLELEEARPLLSTHTTQIIEILDGLKQTGAPSQELLKQLFGIVARAMLPGDDNAEALQTVLDEITASEIEIGEPGATDVFDRQFKKEITG